MEENLKIENLGNYLNICLKKVAESEGFKDYNLTLDGNESFRGKSVAIFYKIKIQENDGSKTLNLVVKSLPKDPNIREKTRAVAKFQREAYIYNQVLPKFLEIQKKNGIGEEKGFFNFPKCFFAEYNEEMDDGVVILEDLSASYKLLSKEEPVNVEHTTLLIKSLGKFHALSLVIKEKDPEFFDHIKNSEDFMIDMLTNTNLKKFAPLNFHRALMVLDNQDRKWSGKITEICKNLNEHLIELVNFRDAEPFAVLTHSDCFTSNLMFHYEDNELRDLKILDWQVSRYGSPVLDLVHFLFSCTDHNLREQHYEELIKIYHESLTEFTEKLGSKINFPFTKLQEQLQKYGRYGFICATFLLPLLTIKREKLPDHELFLKILETPDMYKDIINEYMKPSKKYIEMMRGCIIDSFQYGYM